MGFSHKSASSALLFQENNFGNIVLLVQYFLWRYTAYGIVIIIRYSLVLLRWFLFTGNCTPKDALTTERRSGASSIAVSIKLANHILSKSVKRLKALD